MIRRYSSPSQWRYVETKENPADLATRHLSASSLQGSNWLHGTSFLKSTDPPHHKHEKFQIDENDQEVRKDVKVHVISAHEPRGLGAKRFQRFSSLSSLQRAIASLIVLIETFKLRRSKLKDQKQRHSGVRRSPAVK